MELIREIRNLKSNTIVIEVPDAFKQRRVEILVLTLENLEEEIREENSENETISTSGLCGLWEDERSPQEIINDIYSHRTGFGNRQVAL